MPGTGDGLRGTDEREHMFERYARQIMMPEIEVAGQKTLRASHVLVAGVGGLGSFSSLYLAAIGIGRMTVIDNGSIAISDLNRQILYSPEQVGQPKVLVAEKRLREFNPNVVVETIFGDITEDSLSSHASCVDAVVDGTDNFKTRRILNRVCFQQSVPLIYGGVSGLRGIITTVLTGETPCLECFLPKDEPEKPIPAFGPVVGIVAAIQVREVVSLLLGWEVSLRGNLLHFNVERVIFRKVALKAREDCEVCHGAWKGA